MTHPAIIPAGSCPRSMTADLAATYCGEKTVGTFLKRVGAEYANPCISEGRRRLWGLPKILAHAEGGRS